jgi:hypothetical protein
MPASLANNRSVARQVTLTAIALVALVLVLVGLAIAVLTERSTRAQVVASVGDTAQSVAQSLDAADNTNRELVQLTMKGFQRYFEATMQLDEASGELRSYGALVNEDYGSVDKFASETGGIATVFAEKGDDFVRITTSVKNDKGERQMGTPLGRTDPAYATVSKGEPYTGVTVVNGKPFMGHYLPAKDASGKVIALLFIGNDISVFHAMLQKQVAQTKFFEHGGTYVINPGTSLDQAVFVYHPTARGKRVLEAYPQARPFFEALAASQDGFVREAADGLGTGAENPWALVRKTGGGWWVVAELADGEAMASQRRVTLAVWGLMAVAVVLLAIGLFVMLRRGVSRPLQDLTQAITLVAPLGFDVTTVAVVERLDPARTIGIDMLIDDAATKRRVLATNPATRVDIRNAAHALFARDGKAVSVIRDSGGFVTQRVVATIVNIASDICQQGICTPKDLETAVTLGLGYPLGPLAMGDRWGPTNILEVLFNMQTVYGDTRYRPSPWLRRRGAIGLSLSHVEEA